LEPAVEGVLGRFAGGGAAWRNEAAVDGSDAQGAGTADGDVGWGGAQAAPPPSGGKGGLRGPGCAGGRANARHGVAAGDKGAGGRG